MLDTLYRVLKITVIIAVCAVFMVAINALLGLVGAVVFGSVIGEVIGILSCCLPFDAAFVFGSIGTVITGILAFKLARKIFDLTSWGINSLG